MFSDIHSHLERKEFKDNLKDVIKRAEKAKLNLILTCGIDLESNKQALEIANKFKIVKPTLGVYPSHKDIPNLQEQLNFIEKNKDKIKGIGEVGMDRPMNRNHVNKQKELFIKLIDLAKKINKPLIIHSRGAEKHLVNVLEEENVERAVLHSFNGPEKYAKKAVEMGFFFSIPPRMLTDESFQKIELLIPNQKVLTETDAPFLAKEKDQTNEPKNVVETVTFLSKRRNINMEEQIEKNIKKFLSA